MKKRNIFILFAILMFFIIVTFVNCNTNYISVIKNGFISAYSTAIFPFKSKCNYKLDNYLNKELKNEVDDLKKQLKLNSVVSDFSYVNASVLYRNMDYWYNEITIDKGKKDGISKNDAVISEEGLIGKITKVYSSNSVISLIYNNTNPYGVSVYIDKNEKIYGVLKYNEELVITGINNFDNIEKSDKVITSGLGGVFPSGLFVGYVSKIESNKNGTGKKVIIKPKANFNKIKYVMVLHNK